MPALRVPRADLRIKWDTNAIYFGGGLALYTMHVMSRLTAWKRSARVVLLLLLPVSFRAFDSTIQEESIVYTYADLSDIGMKWILLLSRLHFVHLFG